MVAGACQWLGAATTRASIDLSSSARRKSPMPCVPRSCLSLTNLPGRSSGCDIGQLRLSGIRWRAGRSLTESKVEGRKLGDRGQGTADVGQRDGGKVRRRDEALPFFDFSEGKFR